VGIGLGLLFLAHEGLSFATLRRMPLATDADMEDEETPEAPAAGKQRARARVPG
jgi:hypothetical protein